MINGQEFGWQDIKFYLLGKAPAGILAVTYETKREKKNVYGVGNKPVARARGPKTFEAKITVLQSELEALQQAAALIKPGADLTDMPPFDVVVSYLPEGAGRVVTDVLQDCEFTNIPKASKQGDMNMEVELTLMVGNISYNQV